MSHRAPYPKCPAPHVPGSVLLLQYKWNPPSSTALRPLCPSPYLPSYKTVQRTISRVGSAVLWWVETCPAHPPEKCSSPYLALDHPLPCDPGHSSFRDNNFCISGSRCGGGSMDLWVLSDKHLLAHNQIQPYLSTTRVCFNFFYNDTPTHRACLCIHLSSIYTNFIWMSASQMGRIKEHLGKFLYKGVTVHISVFVICLMRHPVVSFAKVSNSTFEHMLLSNL